MQEHKNPLGRGLEALLGRDTGEGEGITMLAIDRLQRGKYQPRRTFDADSMRDLASSIKSKGVLQPLLVREIDGGLYEIIAGERRWQAAKTAGLDEVPVLIKDLTDSEAFEVSLIENLQRKNLNPLEEAEAFRRLMAEFNYTQEKAAELVGKSRSYIANSIRLLELPKEIKQYLVDEELTAGHARALLKSENKTALAREAVKKKLSVRQTEHLAAKERPVRPKLHRAKESSALERHSSLSRDAGTQDRRNEQLAIDRVRRIAAFLTSRYGMRTAVSNTGATGQLIIDFNGIEELAGVMEILCTMTSRLGFDPE